MGTGAWMPTFIVTLTVLSAESCRRHWALKATGTGCTYFIFALCRGVLSLCGGLCMQFLRGSEKGIRFPRTGVRDCCGC